MLPVVVVRTIDGFLLPPHHSLGITYIYICVCCLILMNQLTQHLLYLLSLLLDMLPLSLVLLLLRLDPGSTYAATHAAS